MLQLKATQTSSPRFDARANASSARVKIAPPCPVSMLLRLPSRGMDTTAASGVRLTSSMPVVRTNSLPISFLALALLLSGRSGWNRSSSQSDAMICMPMKLRTQDFNGCMALSTPMQVSESKGRSETDAVSVRDFNSITRGLIMGCDALKDIWVRGEISNLIRASSGHYYFTLKDEHSELRCTLFRGSAQRLKVAPKDKEEVILRGSADLYMAKGSYQFNVQDLRPVGMGDLHARFEELKNRLKEEGLFEESRKRDLPRYPDRIGVVTSATGSVIRDIINVASRRYPCEIILSPAQVQGVGSSESIVKAMGLLERYGVDVMIVGRGGGSLEDLWPFNEELVARAIHACSVPVISAVGHETDYSISDFVADRRAETPSAAAEMALPDLVLEKRHLLQISSRGDRSLHRMSDEAAKEFRSLDRMLSPRRAMERVEQLMQRVDDLDDDLLRTMTGRSERWTSRLERWDYSLSPKRAQAELAVHNRDLASMFQRMDAAIVRRIGEGGRTLSSVEARIEALDPLRVLDRGYSMILDAEGRPVTSMHQVAEGDNINVRLQDGRLNAVVKDKEAL